MLNPPGPIALRASLDAKDNIGVHEEGGNNAGTFVETYLRSVGLTAGAPWCAAFTSYRIEQASKELHKPVADDFPRSGYCPDYQAWAKKHGVWIPVAMAEENPALVQRGDLCLFYFAAKGRVAHIGIVESQMSGGVISVEGNTSPEVGEGVNRDGDGVYRKKRSWGEFGMGGGFVRLNW